MSEQTGSTNNGFEAGAPRDVLVYGDAGGFVQEIVIGPHRLVADEPKDVGGTDEGPTPYDLIIAGLGACTSITVLMYARRKRLSLKRYTTYLRHSSIPARGCAECETQEEKLDRNQ